MVVGRIQIEKSPSGDFSASPQTSSCSSGPWVCPQGRDNCFGRPIHPPAAECIHGRKWSSRGHGAFPWAPAPVAAAPRVKLHRCKGGERDRSDSEPCQVPAPGSTLPELALHARGRLQVKGGMDSLILLEASSCATVVWGVILAACEEQSWAWGLVLLTTCWDYCCALPHLDDDSNCVWWGWGGGMCTSMLGWRPKEGVRFLL